MTLSDIAALGILVKFTSVLCISPSFSTIKSNKPQFRPIASAILLLVFCALSKTGKYLSFNTELKVLNIFADIITTIMFCLLLITLLTSPMLYNNSWKLFFDLIKQLSNTLEDFREEERITPSKMSIRIAVLHVIYFLNIFSDIIVGAIFLGDFFQIKYDIYRYIFEYISLVGAFLSVQTVYIIRHTFKSFNNLIKHFIALKNNSISSHDIRESDILNMQKMYRDLFKLVGYFNNIFGYQTMFFFATNVLTILSNIQECMTTFQRSYVIVGNVMEGTYTAVNRYRIRNAKKYL